MSTHNQTLEHALTEVVDVLLPCDRRPMVLLLTVLGVLLQYFVIPSEDMCVLAAFDLVELLGEVNVLLLQVAPRGEVGASCDSGLGEGEDVGDKMSLLHFESKLLDPNGEVLVDLPVSKEFIGLIVQFSLPFDFFVFDDPHLESTVNDSVLSCLQHQTKFVIKVGPVLC